jgi:anaerobic selenocysteine-containing dehydrogenase
MDRRRFLKVTVVSGTGAAIAGCAGGVENQIVRFIPDDDLTPGVASWKTGICPLCSAGCGLDVRVMDADVDVVRGGQRGVVRALAAKKLEGRKEHPVNQGGLCARGQSAIQITYHPDRIRQPLKRAGARGSGRFQPVTWEEALAELIAQLDGVVEKGRRSALAYIAPPRPGRRADLVDLFLSRFGARPAMRWEFFDEPVLRQANLLSFGRHQLPTFDLAQARFVLSLGADFLATWNSPVANAAAYGRMRQARPGLRGALAQVEARVSLSGANADHWLPIRPGSEGALVLGLANVILREAAGRDEVAARAGALIDGWPAGLPQFTPDKVASETGIPAARVEWLARTLVTTQPAVVIIGGPALAHTNGLATAVAVNALNALLGAVERPGGVWFTPLAPLPSIETRMRPAPTLPQLTGEILDAAASPVDVLLLDGANPVFASPRAWRVKEALAKIPFIASFGGFLDETSILADLILPDHSFLEGWSHAAPESGAMRDAAFASAPAMRPLYSTRATPDVLIDVSQRLRQPMAPPLPWKSFEELAGAASTTAAPDVPHRPPSRAPLSWAPARFEGSADQYPLHLLPYASVQFYDGSAAHLPWLQEMPDPLTSAMWSSWIEINPATAERLHVANGDMVEVASPLGSVRAPVVITPGVAPDVVAMPVGQGHETYTRYASGRGSNPLSILSPLTDGETGALAWAATKVRVTKVGGGDGELILFAGGTEEHPHEPR